MRLLLSVREVLHLLRTYNELPIRTAMEYGTGQVGEAPHEPEWLHLKCTIGLAMSKCPKEVVTDHYSVAERIVFLEGHADLYTDQWPLRQIRRLKHLRNARDRRIWHESIDFLRVLLAVEVDEIEMKLGEGSMTAYLKQVRTKQTERKGDTQKQASPGNLP